METGIIMAFGGAVFHRQLPRHVYNRTGLRKKDWETVVDDLNRAVDAELGLWHYVIKTVLLPLGVHIVSALSMAHYCQEISSALISVVFIIVLLPVSVGLMSLAQMPDRVARAVATVEPVLHDVNERYRPLGFDFSLMDRREYARRYMIRPKASSLRSGGYVLVVRRLASHDCCLGGPVMQQLPTEFPGEWATGRDTRPSARRKLPGKALPKRRLMSHSSKQRPAPPRPRPTTGPAAV